MHKLLVCLALSLVLLTGCEPPDVIPTAKQAAPHIDLSDNAAQAEQA